MRGSKESSPKRTISELRFFSLVLDSVAYGTSLITFFLIRFLEFCFRKQKRMSPLVHFSEFLNSTHQPTKWTEGKCYVPPKRPSFRAYTLFLVFIIKTHHGQYWNYLPHYHVHLVQRFTAAALTGYELCDVHRCLTWFICNECDKNAKD